MPQLFLLQRTKEVESFTADYIITLGLYRAFYILNWIDRYFWDGDYIDWWVWVGGVIQTILYADFFYYYARRSVLSLQQTNAKKKDKEADHPPSTTFFVFLSFLLGHTNSKWYGQKVVLP